MGNLRPLPADDLVFSEIRVQGIQQTKIHAIPGQGGIDVALQCTTFAVDFFGKSHKLIFQIKSIEKLL